MNSVEVKPTSSGHIRVTIKTGEIVQAQANLDMMQAWTIQREILSAIEKVTGGGVEKIGPGVA